MNLIKFRGIFLLIQLGLLNCQLQYDNNIDLEAIYKQNLFDIDSPQESPYFNNINKEIDTSDLDSLDNNFELDKAYGNPDIFHDMDMVATSPESFMQSPM